MIDEANQSVLTPGSETVRAEVFESALHARTIGRVGSVDAVSWRLIYIERGRADVVESGGSFRLTGPCIGWHPWAPDTRLRISAGAVGAHVLLGAAAVANAVGHQPESADLRFMVERRAYLQLDPGSDVARTVDHAIASIVREGRGDLSASRTIIEAQLRILFVHLWRALGASVSRTAVVAGSQRYFSQFTNLVEVHFRDRWTVRRYASVLGISSDRLTDICRRVRGRSPGEIISARMGVEARLLLENSLDSLDQIAGVLGFQSASHFNRFFKALSGVPPGQYRRLHAGHRPDARQEDSRDLYEWP